MKKNRLGFLLTAEKTEKITVISKSFKKSPQKFIDDIIDSTYEKIKTLELEWDDEEDE